jgi:hypothetical protein
LIDDVDVGSDGIFDCDKIALLGAPGGLASSAFLAWLQSTTNPANVERIHDSLASAPQLTQAQLAKYTLIVVDYLPRAYSAAEAALLQRWVDGGCGLIVMTGHVAGTPAIDYPNSLLAGLGVRFGGPLETHELSSFAAHPVTVGISKPISFVGGYAITADPVLWQKQERLSKACDQVFRGAFCFIPQIPCSETAKIPSISSHTQNEGASMKQHQPLKGYLGVIDLERAPKLIGVGYPPL